jgi:hypothetical protein
LKILIVFLLEFALTSPLLAVTVTIPEGHEGMAYREIDAGKEFPLAVGNHWVYEGICKLSGNGQVYEFKRVEVTDKLTVGDWSLFVLKGHPMDALGIEDLESTKGGKVVDVPGSLNGYLINQNMIFDILSGDIEACKAAMVSKDPDTELNGLATDEVFDFPLIVGKSFNRAVEPEREDHYYEWYVMDEAPSTKWQVEGKPGEEYHLGFYTGPDHTDVWMVPGVGITRYKYHHNGTVIDVDVTLKEYKLAE